MLNAPEHKKPLKFPLAVRLLFQSLRKAGEATGRAYAWNTFGAVAGSLVAGFGLLPWIGLETTLYVAASVHVVAGGLVMLAVSKKRSRLLTAAAAVGASAPK